jgi:multiple sugar transport system permease protein
MNKRTSGTLFLLPGLAGFTLFFLAPFCLSLAYAFVDKPFQPSFAGLRNFADLLANKAYLRGLGNTLRFIALTVPLNLALPLGAALLIRETGKRRDFFTLLFLIPLVIPSGSMVFFWKTFFAQDGVLNGILNSLFGQTVNWLGTGAALAAMTAIFLWKNLGYNMVLYLAALGSIPKEYYEASSIDGASLAQVFRFVTLPCLAPASVLALIMSIINSFKIFREVYLVTGSYPHESIYTLQHFMNNMFVSLNYPKLTSAAAVLILIIALCTQALLRWERRVSL